MLLQLFTSHHLRLADIQFIEHIHQGLEVSILWLVPTKLEEAIDLEEELGPEWKLCRRQILSVRM